MANTVKMFVEIDGKDALKTISAFQNGLTGVGKTAQESTKKASVFGDVIKANLGAIAAVNFADSIKQQITESFDAFAEFEQGLIDTKKTANLTADEVGSLAKNVEDLSLTIPVGTKELLSITEAAGQLNVKGVKNLTNFAETIAKLGRVSDLQGNGAATVLTRILTVTREGVDDVDEFASGIVALGNNFAATESEIAFMTNEVARATAQFGLSAGEAAALSATMRSLGIRSEESGTVIGKSFRSIKSAIEGGGAALTQLEMITGESGETLRKEFGENSLAVFQKFLQGTKRLSDEGAILSDEFLKIGLTGERVQKIIPTLSANYDELSRAIETFNEGAQDANALNDEFAESAKSTNSQVQLLSNSIDKMQRQVGEKLAKAFNIVTPSVAEFISRIGEDKVSVFARTTDDIDKLKKELATYQQTLKAVEDNDLGLPSFLLEDKGEVEGRIKIIQDRINELDASNAVDQLNKIKDQIDTLKGAGGESSPLLDSIYGTPDERQARLKLLQEQYDNIKQMQALQNNELADLRQKDNEDSANKTKEKFDVLNELNAKQAEYEKELKVVEDEQKAIDDQVNLERLKAALGEETALKEVAKIRELQGEEKQSKALKKLRDKARKNEREGQLFQLDFEKKVGKEKVESQKGTLNAIATLTSSSNSFLFNIGKAAALTNAGIAQSQAVVNAYRDVPYPFNIPASIAVGAAAAVQIAKIASAKPPTVGKFAEGGTITGRSGVNDRLLAEVNAGETILNRRQTDTVFRAIDQGNIGGGGDNFTFNNPVFLNEEGIDMVIEKINDAIEFRNQELRTA